MVKSPKTGRELRGQNGYLGWPWLAKLFKKHLHYDPDRDRKRDRNQNEEV